MNFSERLKDARARAHLSQRAVAEKLYLSQAAYAKYESNVATPSPETLKRIAEVLDVSVDYLTGNDVSPLKGIKNIVPIKTKKVPLLGDISCGQPIYAEEQYGEFASIREDIDCDFCLRCVGDSMIGARILDGDVVFCREQSTVDNGEIAAVIIEDEATLKRVYYYPEQGKMILSPENPAYAPLVYDGEDLNRITILGKAVAFQSRVK